MKPAAARHAWHLVGQMLVYSISGCVANVAVAWACMLWSPIRSVTLPPVPPDRSIPHVIQGPTGPGYWQFSRGVGVRVSDALEASTAEGKWFRYFLGPQASAFESGWPLLSMRSIVEPYYDRQARKVLARWDLPLAEILRRGPQLAELPAIARTHFDRRLPLRPLPLGCAVDAALFSIGAWIVMRYTTRIVGRSKTETRGFPIEVGGTRRVS